MPPADLQWSLFGVPEQLENDETQEAYWELGKFIRLALKANPGILECLYTPIVEEASDLARKLLEMRQIFLSKLVYQTFNGYVLSQFKKLEQDLRTRGVIKWKHAMHLIRLLLSGVRIMRDHDVPVRVIEHRERLLAIRRRTVPWQEVDSRRLELHKEFDERRGIAERSINDSARNKRPDGRGCHVAMWYNSRLMAGRNTALLLLVVLAAQMAGTMAFASVCLEPCPDDVEGANCPPVCSLCTSCTHAQIAVVGVAVASILFRPTLHFLPQERAFATSHLAADIFHIPLLG